MADVDRDAELAELRDEPANVHLAGGYGPLIVGVVLFVMMVLLAPTVAPEQVVERPVHNVSTTAVTLATTTTLPTSTTAPAAEAP